MVASCTSPRVANTDRTNDKTATQPKGHATIEQLGRDLHGGHRGHPARSADEQALLAGEPPGDVHALLGGGGDHAGEQRDVQVARDEAVADALDAVVPPGALREQRALRTRT